MKAVVTVTGRDVVGIIAKVSAACAEYKANIIDISQSVLSEYFAMIMVVEIDQIAIITYGVVNSIKITFPRKTISGSLDDNDIYGCQQHIPLGNLII